MSAVGEIIATVLFVYWLLMLARLVLDFVQVFARSWQPTGIMLVIAEFVYSVTDPPIKAVRRVVPPLRLGSIQFDLAFLIVLIALQFLMSIFRAL